VTHAHSIMRFAMVLAFAITPGLSAQNKSAANPTWNPPLTPDGQPDIQGSWVVAQKRELAISAAFDIENGEPPEEGSLQGGRQTFPPPEIIADPPNGKVPYQPWARAVYEQNRWNSIHPTRLEHLDSVSRCLESGMPRSAIGGPGRILQTPGYVIVVKGNGTRFISLDGRPHIPTNIKLWGGDSVGHWDGNTLVVDVTNINEYAYYDWAGNFHSNELRLAERWAFSDPKSIVYEVTNYDPKVFTKPWTMKALFTRNKNQNGDQIENACYEGEKDVEVMLPHDKTQDSLK
jgi:hypothetical protein